MTQSEFNQTISAVNKLAKLAKTLNRLYTNNCNGFYSEKAAKANATRIKNIEIKAANIAQDAGLFIYFQTDPRGCAIYVSIDPLTDSNYNIGKGL